MIITDWKTLEPIVNKDGILAQRIYDKSEGQIIHMALSAGASLKPHKTPVNVAFYVLDGTLTIEIGEERSACTAGNMIESPLGIPHALYNESNADVHLLVMKLPKP
ncbi:MAG: cupin domain-containing protein [Candidatus Cloacimonetes bacterium HGW-Cloacimonetes-1]|jgi:quercetin dioxygenase-like cupin family protein|nr:MAG: cupin domain-containing protein [Candidatus Cloacimonetes bacterium HGW-Cloacimonetes-1]